MMQGRGPGAPLTRTRRSPIPTRIPALPRADMHRQSSNLLSTAPVLDVGHADSGE